MRTYIVRDNTSSEMVGYFSLKAGLISRNERDVEVLNEDTGEDDAFESVLKLSLIDESAAKLEDSEANAFAALFLVPREFLLQQADIYGIRRGRIVLKDVLKLMDNFAVPYKAMVLRLYEEDFIDRKKADELLNVDNSVIEEEIRLTGISTRWQSSQRRRHY